MTAPGPLGLTIVTFPYLSPAGGLTPDPDPEPEGWAAAVLRPVPEKAGAMDRYWPIWTVGVGAVLELLLEAVPDALMLLALAEGVL